jgi:RNA polymerase sigma factor (TIGR02999 family)
MEKLLPLVYGELRELAKRHMARQTPGHTLQTTALIHEAYLKLVQYPHVKWSDRVHFFAFAAQVMRSLLVDHARRQRAAKRGGPQQKVSLEEVAVIAPAGSAAVLDLNEALERLTAIDPRKGRIVELRHFGGLSVEEVAEVLEVAPITVKREWARAKAWLHRELHHDE